MVADGCHGNYNCVLFQDVVWVKAATVRGDADNRTDLLEQSKYVMLQFLYRYQALSDLCSLVFILDRIRIA